MHRGINQLLNRVLRKGETTPGLCGLERHPPPETSPPVLCHRMPIVVRFHKDLAYCGWKKPCTTLDA